MAVYHSDGTVTDGVDGLTDEQFEGLEDRAKKDAALTNIMNAAVVCRGEQLEEIKKYAEVTTLGEYLESADVKQMQSMYLSLTGRECDMNEFMNNSDDVASDGLRAYLQDLTKDAKDERVICPKLGDGTTAPYALISDIARRKIPDAISFAGSAHLEPFPYEIDPAEHPNLAQQDAFTGGMASLFPEQTEQPAQISQTASLTDAYNQAEQSDTVTKIKQAMQSVWNKIKQVANKVKDKVVEFFDAPEDNDKSVDNDLDFE